MEKNDKTALRGILCVNKRVYAQQLRGWECEGHVENELLGFVINHIILITAYASSFAYMFFD